MIIAVRAKPGSRTRMVGGTWGDGRLVVAVPQRAVDGAANRAVVAAVAEAFDLPRSAVSLVRGERGRDKLLAVEGDPVELQQRLAHLLQR